MVRLLLLLGLAASEPVTAPAPPTILIRGARVIDGRDRAPRVRDVLIRGDRIAAVARRLRTRAARVIEADGMTLLPGLHDRHVHSPPGSFASPDATRAAYAPFLERGITRVTDLSVPTDRFTAIHATAGLPRLRLSVRIGVPGGHGTESERTRGLTKLVSTPAEVRTAMPALLALRPDVVKVFADGWRYGRDRDRPDMDEATLAAIVRAAHRAEVPVMTHTVTLAGLKRAARAGVDALAHGVGDAPLDREALRLLSRTRMTYIPTLAAYEPLAERRLTAAEWQALSPAMRAHEQADRLQPTRDYDARRWAIMRANLRAAHAAGVRIAAGTDAGVTGVHAGWATLHELRLLTENGLAPAEAIRAALPDRARIRRGAPADLLLVAGAPDRRIEDLHRIRAVFVAGVQVSPLPR